MKNKTAILVLATLTAATVPAAHAGRVSVHIGGSIALPLPVPVFSTRVYAAPAPVPVYVQTAPIAACAPLAPAAPVYGGPPTVVYSRPVYAQPVYVAPPPVYHASPAYYHRAAPFFGFSIGFGGHHHRSHRHCR